VRFPELLLLAVGLSMDAMAVAAARGLAAERVRARDVLLVAGLFGGFQAGMPLLGWLLGSGVGPWIAEWDHWIAFGVLAGLGLKMLREALATEPGEAVAGGPVFATRTLLVLAVATGIDALAVGVTLPLLGAPLGLSLVTIGVTTAVLSAVGVYAGRLFGALLGRRLDAAGGVVLVLLGVKILVEHLTA
jgi:putative Mn2+ efflux pump MntP